MLSGVELVPFIASPPLRNEPKPGHCQNAIADTSVLLALKCGKNLFHFAEGERNERTVSMKNSFCDHSDETRES